MEQVTQTKSKPCPFCGSTPHHGLTKKQHCQLHGDEFQRFEIWCPKGHARVNGVNENAANREWNTRTNNQAKDEEIARYREALEQLLDAYITTCLFDGAAMFEVEQHNAVRLARETLGGTDA